MGPLLYSTFLWAPSGLDSTPGNAFLFQPRTSSPRVLVLCQSLLTFHLCLHKSLVCTYPLELVCVHPAVYYPEVQRQGAQMSRQAHQPTLEPETHLILLDTGEQNCLLLISHSKTNAQLTRVSVT